jgi:hypothetical protein
MNIIAANGELKIMVYMYKNQYEGWVIDMATEHGYLEVVKFLHENRVEWCTVKAINYACQNGHFNVV